jgi:hypothetical protein
VLDRLMGHCEDVNNTTNTHPMEPGETEEERKEWMYSPEIRHIWEQRQTLERENAKLATKRTTTSEWKDFMRKQKCVSCPEDGFQGALLAALYAGSKANDAESSVLMISGFVRGARCSKSVTCNPYLHRGAHHN